MSLYRSYHSEHSERLVEVVLGLASRRIVSGKILAKSLIQGGGGEGKKHGTLRAQKPLRLIRDGEAGGLGILYLTPTRYTLTTRMILH